MDIRVCRLEIIVGVPESVFRRGKGKAAQLRPSVDEDSEVGSEIFYEEAASSCGATERRHYGLPVEFVGLVKVQGYLHCLALSPN